MAELILDGTSMGGNIVDRNLERELSKPKSIKLSDYPSMVCPNCGCKLFTTAMVIKEVPGIAMGIIGKDKVPFPVEQYPIIVCAKCGEISPAMYMQEGFDRIKDKLIGDNETINENGVD